VKRIRIAFFADLHIQGNKIQSQTDIGAPTKIIPQKTQQALNKLKPDFIFGLGDQTTYGAKKDWLGYKKWLKGVNAPVFEVLGNHDRDYTILTCQNTGKDYFQVLKKTSDTTVYKIGNFIFILVSEEHNPESGKHDFTSTIPEKSFQFIQNILKKYSKNNNIFILNHTPILGTTALSDEWVFNDLKHWKKISKKYLALFKKYQVLAHLTGHIHIDYRFKNSPININGKQVSKKIGKFINGKNFSYLPSTYFLNMPCVDVAHGWAGDLIPKWVLRIFARNSFKSWGTFFAKFYFKNERFGPPLWDWFSKTKFRKKLKSSAIYYLDIYPNKKELKIITHRINDFKDVETYPLQLKYKSKLSSKNLKLLSSDLSLIHKKNLTIGKHNWFKVKKGKTGFGEFSKSFTKPTRIKGVKVIGKNLGKYQIKYQASKDNGKTWNKTWIKDPQKLGKINAIKLKIKFYSSSSCVQIKDIKIIKVI